MYNLNSINILTRLWIDKIEKGSTYIESATKGNDGSIYIAGWFTGDFQNNTNTGLQGFVSKYDIDGNNEWVNIIDDYFEINSISTNSDGSIFLTGRNLGPDFAI